MNEQIDCLVTAPDGRQQQVTLPGHLLECDCIGAPAWLLSLFGLRQDVSPGWRLRAPLSGEETGGAARADSGVAARLHKRHIVRAVSAGAGGGAFDPRQARLKKERLALEKLNLESDYVRVEPLEVLEGSEPERYRVIFFCRGIKGVDASQHPLYADQHEVLIHCDDEFPSDVPKLRWETPIWHPNIQHDEPKGVCVNKPEWLGGMGLDDLVRLMFEMVQYKNYHAEVTPPFPLDQDAATWVRDYAEPMGIVDKKRNISVDDKPFTRPTDAAAAPPAATSRIKLLTRPLTSRIKLLDPTSREAAPAPPERSRIKVVKTE